jgi:hypothetical protein
MLVQKAFKYSWLTAKVKLALLTGKAIEGSKQIPKTM